MSKPTIHGRRLAARSLALVALASLVVLAGHSGGRPALSGSGNLVSASKPADQTVSSLATTLDRAPQALGTVPLDFVGKRESLYPSVATQAGGGRFAVAGKTASAKTEESIRVLKQRGQ